MQLHASLGSQRRAHVARSEALLNEPGCRFALGTRAPQVSGVKVFKSAASGGADSDNVTIELQVLWGGNPVSSPAHSNRQSGSSLQD